MCVEFLLLFLFVCFCSFLLLFSCFVSCLFLCLLWLVVFLFFVLFFRSFFVIQIHKRLKRTPFIRTKYNMRILESNST